MAQWLCEVVHQFDIAPEAFIPPPKVTSSVISLIPRKEPLAPANKATLEKICKFTFNQRRKTLRSSLKQLTPTPELLLEKAGIAPTRRPEELTVEEFCALSRAWDTLEHFRFSCSLGEPGEPRGAYSSYVSTVSRQRDNANG